MRLTKFNADTGLYEYIEPAKTQEEFIAQRKAVIQKLGEYEEYESYLGTEVYVKTSHYIETCEIGEVRYDGEEITLVAYDICGEEYCFKKQDIGSMVLVFVFVLVLVLVFVLVFAPSLTPSLEARGVP